MLLSEERLQRRCLLGRRRLLRRNHSHPHGDAKAQAYKKEEAESNYGDNHGDSSGYKGVHNYVTILS